ncbi:sensor domain-containing diguanylate cyclase [Tunturiibacter lichenicola]|uniref:sensor domain-containing diguanylate cyclase n=1 Tax=Tunturiibacter lichenicola TaxID=2051959 RepID=UPI0021B4B9BC|nr:GGDEF domain-containing protein [Edaphobacter lichenicola]
MLSLPSVASSDRVPLKPSRVIPLLAICAVGAVAFTCAGGFIVYTNTQHLISTRNWLDHSHSVLTSLQTEAQRLDRVSYEIQLYEATGDKADKLAAQTAAVSLHAGALNLESLQNDNPSQMRHLQELDSEVRDLNQAIDGIERPGVVPERLIQDCRRTINAEQEEERGLLRQRSDESQDSRDRSLLSGAGYLGFSLFVVIALFAFLLRDAVRRRSFERQISDANDQLEATIEELERRGAEAILLKEARDELQLCVTAKEAQECAVRHFRELVPGSCGATLIINNSRSMLEMAATWNDPAALADAFEMDACCGLRAGRLRWRRPGQSELHCSHFVGSPPDNYVCIPLAAQGDTLGFVFLSFPTREIAGLAGRRMQMVQEMVELASMAIAGLNLRAKLESQSIRDGLTSLFNRHFMEIALEREVQRAARRHTSLAVLMLDVDHFKVFNDTFGHEAGDMVLRRIAECFQQTIRSEDIVCRYGGEEFVILLPEITEELALAKANTIRHNVSGLRMKLKEEALRSVSVSIGLAMYPAPARDATDLLRMADHALYDAKRGGRDRVVVARASFDSSGDKELTTQNRTLDPNELNPVSI